MQMSRCLVIFEGQETVSNSPRYFSKCLSWIGVCHFALFTSLIRGWDCSLGVHSPLTAIKSLILKGTFAILVPLRIGGWMQVSRCLVIFEGLETIFNPLRYFCKRPLQDFGRPISQFYQAQTGLGLQSLGFIAPWPLLSLWSFKVPLLYWFL
jgi:hypothetical protein